MEVKHALNHKIVFKIEIILLNSLVGFENLNKFGRQTSRDICVT